MTTRARSLLFAWLASLSVFACGSDDDKSAPGPSAPPSYPAESSSEAIAEFLEGDPYKREPWQAQTTEPREPGQVSPHGRVIVYWNDVLLASDAAGNGDPTPHTAGSMTVKEFYEGATVIGRAVMLKTEGDRRDWVYWCLGESARCGVNAETETEAYYGPRTTGCGMCHGGYVYTLEEE